MHENYVQEECMTCVVCITESMHIFTCEGERACKWQNPNMADKIYTVTRPIHNYTNSRNGNSECL